MGGQTLWPCRFCSLCTYNQLPGDGGFWLAGVAGNMGHHAWESFIQTPDDTPLGPTSYMLMSAWPQGVTKVLHVWPHHDLL